MEEKKWGMKSIENLDLDEMLTQLKFLFLPLKWVGNILYWHILVGLRSSFFSDVVYFQMLAVELLHVQPFSVASGWGQKPLKHNSSHLSWVRKNSVLKHVHPCLTPSPPRVEDN